MPRIVWSESAGRRGRGLRPSTVVRVFERADSPGRIYIERCWIDGPGRVRALKDGVGREAAAAIAKKTAAEREERWLAGRDAFGDPKVPTLREVMRRYHKSPKARKWVEKHRLEQERCRDFWLSHLGDVPVTEENLRPDLVEEIAADAAEASSWSSRTEEKYLKYLMAVTRWGRRKARMYRRDPLEGLDLPEVRSDTRKRIHTLEEARLLAFPHPDVDWRVTLAYALAVVHGRRISAILHLWAGLEGSDQEPDWTWLKVRMARPDGSVEDVERMFLHYRAEFDKGNRDEWVPVPTFVATQVLDALERPEVQDSGWFFPEGRLGYDDPRDKPWDATSAIDALHRAERTLGIQPVPHRGYHGGKRLHVTKSFQVAGGDASLVGDITGNVSEWVLKTIYRQKELPQMVRQVDGVTALLEGSGGVITDRNADRDMEAGEGDSGNQSD